MRNFWKPALLVLATASPALWLGAGRYAVADPFGRVERGAGSEPAPQVFVNPYASPAHAKLPNLRLAALGQAVRVERLSEAYRASPLGQTASIEQTTPVGPMTPMGRTVPPAELPAPQAGASYATAPAMLPNRQTARPLTPTASANAPATIVRDQQVVPAAYGTGHPTESHPAESSGNPLRGAAFPAGGSGNPLR